MKARTAFLALVSSAALALGCGDAAVSSPGYNYHVGAGGPSHGGTGTPGTGTPNNGQPNNGADDAGIVPDPIGNPSPGGSDAGAVTPPPQTASYDVSLDNAAPASDLFANTDLVVTIAPNGYSGQVALTVTGAPSDVTYAFDKPSLTLDGTTSATAKLRLTTATSSKAGTTPLQVVATSASGVKSTQAMLTVRSTLTIQIPAGVLQLGGTQGNPVKSAFGSYPITITAPDNISSQNPVTIHFYNADNVSHEIHASSPNAGFPHDNGPTGPGQMDGTRRAVNQKGTFDFYLHDQGGPATVGRIVIQ